MELFLTFFLVGLGLLFVEIMVTPGATVFGAIGIVCMVIANLIAFKTLDSTWAWATLIISLLVTCFSLYLMFRMLQSKNLSVQAQITNKVNVLDQTKFHLGQIGKTITNLRPEGRALFDQEIAEVFSMGNFIEEGSEVEIVKMNSEKIFVQLVKQL